MAVPKKQSFKKKKSNLKKLNYKLYLKNKKVKVFVSKNYFIKDQRMIIKRYYLITKS